MSKSSAFESLRLKKSGFRALLVLPSISNKLTAVSISSKADLDGGYSLDNMNRSSVSAVTMPPAHILCTFLDGGVGVYDLMKRKWIFLREMVILRSAFITCL